MTHGQDQAFTITADPFYHVSNVTVDAVSVGTPSLYTFTNVTASHVILAVRLMRPREPYGALAA